MQLSHDANDVQARLSISMNCSLNTQLTTEDGIADLRIKAPHWAMIQIDTRKPFCTYLWNFELWHPKTRYLLKLKVCLRVCLRDRQFASWRDMTYLVWHYIARYAANALRASRYLADRGRRVDTRCVRFVLRAIHGKWDSATGGVRVGRIVRRSSLTC